VRDCEALLRWHEPELGDIGPEESLSAAERSGLADQLGAWVIDMACHDVAAWRRRGIAAMRATINVSFRQLVAGDLATTLFRALTRHGLSPQDIGIEFTENMLICSNPRTLDTLHALHNAGCRIALDDFGTGVASLRDLKRLPVDLVKIDQDLVGDIPHDKASCAVVDAVIGMAHSLGKQVLAEGVETDRQLEYVARAGCELLQGFRVCRPLAAADVPPGSVLTNPFRRGSTSGPSPRP
jgi:EAL domain-containing protein (putative c-di-GMP-specific phosphodiesterase class I)